MEKCFGELVKKNAIFEKEFQWVIGQTGAHKILFGG